MKQQQSKKYREDKKKLEQMKHLFHVEASCAEQPCMNRDHWQWR